MLTTIQATLASVNGAVGASQGPLQSNTSSGQTTSAHARLVERLLERKNLLPIAASECSRLVMKVFDHHSSLLSFKCISFLAAYNPRGSLRVDNGPDRRRSEETGKGRFQVKGEGVSHLL